MELELHLYRFRLGRRVAFPRQYQCRRGCTASRVPGGGHSYRMRPAAWLDMKGRGCQALHEVSPMQAISGCGDAKAMEPPSSSSYQSAVIPSGLSAQSWDWKAQVIGCSQLVPFGRIADTRDSAGHGSVP